MEGINVKLNWTEDEKVYKAGVVISKETKEVTKVDIVKMVMIQLENEIKKQRGK